MFKNNTPFSKALMNRKSVIQFFSDNSNILGIIALAMAAILTAFAGIFIKVSETEIGSNATVFNRLWIATIFFWFWELVVDSPQLEDSPSKDYQQKALLILVALVSTVSMMCWAWSLTQTSVANSTVLRNLTPLFTSIGGWLLLNQNFDRKFILGMTIAIMGAIIIGWDDLYITQENLLGDGIALISALFYAAYLLIVEHLQVSLSATKILLWRCTFGTLFLLPIVLLTEEHIFPNSWQGWLSVIALALICQVLGQGLLIYSLKYFSSAFVAVFLLVSPIITALLAWLIFAESLDILNGIAFILVLGGIYLAKSS